VHQRERLKTRIPLPPILFNLVVNILSRMLQRAAGEDLIRGLGNKLVDG
jgi:hypothetical protein